MNQILKNGVFLIAALLLASGCTKKKSSKSTEKAKQLQQAGAPNQPEEPHFDLKSIPEKTQSTDAVKPPPTEVSGTPVVPSTTSETEVVAMPPPQTIPSLGPAVSTTTAPAPTSTTTPSTSSASITTQNPPAQAPVKPAPVQPIQQQTQEAPQSTPIVETTQREPTLTVPPLSIEVKTEKIVLYGTKDFRQPDGAINYTVKRRTGTTTSELKDIKKGINSEVTSILLQWGTNEIGYSFGLEAASNGLYPLAIKDGSGETQFYEYAFYKGSAEQFKNGESVTIVLSQASWIKLHEYEMKKVLDERYGSLRNLEFNFTRTPERPTHARTCNLGKGYFLGSHALACNEPDMSFKAVQKETQ